MLGTDAGEHVPCVIGGRPGTAGRGSICGMTDLVVDYQTTRLDIRPYSEEMMGGSPAMATERYREHSPIHYCRPH